MQAPTSKPELRKILRERRRAIPGEQRSRASLAAARHVQALPAWSQARHVALYLPADGEVDTAELAALARSRDQNLYLPVVGGDKLMHFALWEPGAVLRENHYGIPEPDPTSPQWPVAKLDLVLMPLVGWSKSGARLGMGGGFYDRALAGTRRPLRVGLGYECQQVEALPAEEWDIPMDFVATEAALHACGETN